MSDLPPIVLVHGAWHGSWCWDDVADALRAQGRTVVAIDLPGHDAPGTHPRIWKGVGSYVRALEAAVAELDGPPILVGHSMGGYVVQRYLERHGSAGAVLVAPVPGNGVLGITLRLLRDRPLPTLRAVATASLWPVVAAPGSAESMLLGPHAPAGAGERIRSNLQNESFVAFVQMLVRWPRPTRITTLTVVVAAELDALFTRREHQRLADALGTPLEVLSGSGHDAMLDVAASELTDLIHRWVPA